MIEDSSLASARLDLLFPDLPAFDRADADLEAACVVLVHFHLQPNHICL